MLRHVLCRIRVGVLRWTEKERAECGASRMSAMLKAAVDNFMILLRYVWVFLNRVLF